MREGLRLVVRHAFGALGLHRLEANIQPKNRASIRLVKRAGFTRGGIFSALSEESSGAGATTERWAITAEAFKR